MSETLKPWHAIATPHEDIRKGRLDEAVFAANLWNVVQGSAPEVYADPEMFFRKTYMTTGLKTLLKRVSAVLASSDEGGDRVVSLQTSFGGGKTHLLIALWHLARSGDKLASSPDGADLRKAVGGVLPGRPVNVAVFTNESCDATQGRVTPEGVHVRTAWGEIALQLGGRLLYEKIRANDEARTVPQGIFEGILREAAPCLILLDELADYCVGAAASPVGGTTLADQTISFIQQLTQAVANVPNAIVVATLPASKAEVAQSEKGYEAFATLEKRFQRLGADIRPVADDEIYEVVRTRLFESVTPPGQQSYVDQVAGAFQELYSSYQTEVGEDAIKPAYRDLIARSYPFHPSLINTLYTRWGSHSDFQRTRGVLRLLAAIVADLWDHRKTATQSQPLIQPCHLNWALDPLQAQYTRLWGIGYQSVMAADVVGEGANATAFDRERGGDYEKEAIGRGLASAILLGSVGGSSGRGGLTSREIRLATSRPDLNWNYTDGALMELENRCFYLHAALAGAMGKRYWFFTKPNLNKLVAQYRQQYASRDFDEEIVEALRAEGQKTAGAGATWRILVDPAKDLPEQKSLTLLVLHPRYSWTTNGNGNGNTELIEVVRELSARCGTKERIYRNTLVFLAPTSKGLARLRQAYRELGAREAVQRDYGSQLDEADRIELRKQTEDYRKAVGESLGPAYTVAARIHGNEVETCVLSDSRHSLQEHLGYLWSTLVEDPDFEWIVRRVGPVTLRESGIVPEHGQTRLSDAVDAFLRFTDKKMVASRSAVADGLARACADGVVGIARGTSPTTFITKHCRETITLDPSEEGVWVIPPFEPEKPSEPTKTDTVSSIEGGGATKTGSDTTPSPSGRRVRSLKVKGKVPLESYNYLFNYFIHPAAALQAKLELGVDFQFEIPNTQTLDANDARLKTMQEAAGQLGLKFEVEEESHQ